jgi:PAS domain S-box-containing protein
MSADYEGMSHEELVRMLRRLQGDPRELQSAEGPERLIHELQVHQIELEMQNRELRETQQQLEESRSRYADLYDLAPVAYCTVDVKGRIVEANLTAAALFALERVHLAGRSLAQIVRFTDAQAFRRHLARCIAEKGRVLDEMSFLVNGRGPVVAQLTSMPILGPTGEVEFCKTTFTDVSALKQSEELFRFLADASEAFVSSFDYESGLEALVRRAVPDLADVCFVDLREEDDSIRRMPSTPINAEAKDVESSLSRHEPGRVWTAPEALVLQSGEPILIAKASKDGPLGLGEGAPRISSLMLTPLTARQRTFGVLSFVMSSSQRTYTAKELTIAIEIARRAAIAIDNARLYRMAQKAIRSRDDVLAVVSHDLRNPVSAISLNAEAILRDEPPVEPKAEKRLSAIRHATHQLTYIINDLLDLASLEAGRLSCEMAFHAVREVVHDALELLEPLAQDKQISLTADVPEEPSRVLCDKSRVLQVLSNLVGNAVKFTPAHGSIVLRVVVGAEQAHFAVADTGPGIPRAALSHVFDRYWRGADQVASEGRGLGLYIAKGIVEALGGSIHVDSEPGEGTTFTFSLSVEKSTRHSDEVRGKQSKTDIRKSAT